MCGWIARFCSCVDFCRIERQWRHVGPPSILNKSLLDPTKFPLLLAFTYFTFIWFVLFYLSINICTNPWGSSLVTMEAFCWQFVGWALPSGAFVVLTHDGVIILHGGGDVAPDDVGAVPGGRKSISQVRRRMSGDPNPKALIDAKFERTSSCLERLGNSLYLHKTDSQFIKQKTKGHFTCDSRN